LAGGWLGGRYSWRSWEVKWVAGGDRTRGRGPAGRVASSGSATTDELVPQAGLGATAAEAGQVGEAGLGDAWSRGAWVWDAAFYALLALAAGAALLAGNQSPRERLLTVGLVLLLALWHRVASRRVPPDQDTIRDALVYVAGVYLLWFALVSVDTVFFLMLWVLYPWTFRLLPIRAGIAAALVLTGLVTWRELTIPGLSVDERIGTASTSAVAAIAGVLFAIWINRIINQSAERRQLIEQLTSTRRELAAAERQAGVLEERERLAREIHDTLAQGFTSIVLQLQAAEAAWASGSPGARLHLEQARRTASENLAEARRLVWALQPEPLGDASLAEALVRLTGRLAEEQGIQATTRVTGVPRPLTTATEVALLRITQEALANVRRHARAGRVTVTLSYMEDLAVLDVQDDGVGFDPRASARAAGPEEGGFGLAAMRQRVDRLGGSLVVESAPGAGTTVVVELPVDGEAADPQAPADQYGVRP
jgi:signal transduction histidine kinase